MKAHKLYGLNKVAENYSTRQLIMDIRENLIDPNPSYQRPGVWSIERKRKFVKSVFNRDIHKQLIIFAYAENQDFIFEIFDGKQRLFGAVWEFVNDGFSCVLNGKNVKFSELDRWDQEKITEFPWDIDIKPKDLSIADKRRQFVDMNTEGVKMSAWHKLCSLRAVSPVIAYFLDQLSSADFDTFNEMDVAKVFALVQNPTADFMKCFADDKSFLQGWDEKRIRHVIQKLDFIFRRLDSLNTEHKKFLKCASGLYFLSLLTSKSDSFLELNKHEIAKTIQQMSADYANCRSIKKSKAWSIAFVQPYTTWLLDTPREFTTSTKLGALSDLVDPLNGKDYQFDHVVPHSVGGTSTPDNCQAILKEENLKKGNRANLGTDQISPQ